MKRLLQASDVWSRIDVRGADECWLWARSVTTAGYGQFYFDGRRHTAHRVAWEQANGPVPEGLQLDHLCRNRRCCNPAHLEAVTCRTNVLRGEGPAARHAALTHCPVGHPYSGTNLRVRPSDGARLCRACSNADSRKRKRARRRAFASQGLTSRGTPFYRPQAARDGGLGCPGTTGGEQA